jgi:hypothetical protein
MLYGIDGYAFASDSMLLTLTNIPPTADAGVNIAITSEQIYSTIIQGTVTDEDGDELLCRWKEGTSVLLDWTPAEDDGGCPLDLNSLSLGIGTYNLFLEVDDGQATSVNEMILTIDNSAPHAAPGGGGVYEITTDVILVGNVSDFDGDLLNYQWIEGSSNVLCSGSSNAVTEGLPVLLPDCVTTNLSLGTHTISLLVDDGLNLPDSNNISVEIVDSTVPTIAPIADIYILWPPNHIMENIAIEANASDNSGFFTLNATVISNESENDSGDGDVGPDMIEPVIDQDTGMIYLQLRRERSGSGNGRVYTVTITATDNSGNSSSAAINIIVPHDKSKKK